MGTQTLKAQTYSVKYEEEGFKGTVYFKIKKDATIFKDGFSFKLEKSASKNVIESYKNGQYDAILNKAGIRFPITQSQTSSSDRVDLSGTVHFYLSAQRRTRHNSQPSVNLNIFDAWPNFPDFSESAKEYLINYAEKQGTNLWTQTGELDNLKVTDAYLFELKDKVESAIRKHETEQLKLANQKKEQQQSAKNTTPTTYGSTLGSSIGNSAGSKAYSASSNKTASPKKTYSANNSSYSSRSSSTGFYKDPELNKKAEAQRLKMEESQRKIAAMRATMRRQQEESERLNNASKQTFTAMGNAKNFTDYVNAGKPLMNEFAKQGNVWGAAAAGAISFGGGILSEMQANKAKKEAAAREQAERDRIYKQQQEEKRKYEAEQARLRQQAFELLISQRHTILDAFSDNDPVPLSTTKVGASKIYYFIYATDPATIDTKKTTVYVSNVFEIRQYKDGTWPYQSSLESEFNNLTPFNEVLHGYYLNAADAESMRTEFINGFRMNEGVSVVDIAYKEPAVNNEQQPTGQKETSPANEGLGIKIGPALKSAPKPSQTKQTESGALGIPIKL